MNQSEQFSLVCVLERIIDIYKRKYPDYTIVLTKRVSDMQLVANESAVETIFSNLIDNACKYSSPDDAITISLDGQGVTFADKGIGIASQDQEHIWQAFWQRDKNRKDGV